MSRKCTGYFENEEYRSHEGFETGSSKLRKDDTVPKAPACHSDEKTADSVGGIGWKHRARKMAL
ncbi:hypothetical protein HMPREF0762_01365 [Slackia exigua ATCC 700122]|uniref:Uncharacterized protein n=1 Tax=Slackia exigua (strain ATCC 700122 / DSM 15923 / CIP 105133 / JCM 11022 / KCTC 5966 / S-7) TaxID=649764 RepID=D0WHP7_SLAES|nr:hypothetical protein HMPREF0762_01365 [Slackia exigua ATCC 700122]